MSNDNTTQSGQGSEVNDTEASPNIIKKVNSFLDDIGVGRGDWEDIKDLTKNDLKKETLGRIFSIGLFDSSKLFHGARSEKSSEFKNDETLEKYIRRISG